ncbi:TetR/AcrR family transcriptional regulator [Virgibacillus salexigens]|uniref:Division inhibitor protein n=1 Tax=Virgibacillus massiliensis TaxID=1462526 RepID=A0A024Q6R6_9BACI|nr:MULTISPECIES: TetR/AcrR family transcriptional regulator [Virgibacillus]MYL41299.1 TetR family transcriptional regulator [Virgibacillus massiliensis]CDQ37905.1 division inhibitor protein [Virgibacillus massiliensis]
MKVDRRVHKSKNALKTALIQLMKEKDMQQITITDIVNKADLNRGTFYKHYDIQEALFEELMEDVITDLTQSFREPYQNKQTFILHEMNASTIKIFEHVARYSDFYQTIINHDTIFPGFQQKLCTVFRDLSEKDLISTKEEGAIDKDLQASYQTYAIIGMIMEWVKNGFKYTPEYMADQLIKMLSHSPITMTYQTSQHSHSPEQTL